MRKLGGGGTVEATASKFSRQYHRRPRKPTAKYNVNRAVCSTRLFAARGMRHNTVIIVHDERHTIARAKPLLPTTPAAIVRWPVSPSKKYGGLVHPINNETAGFAVLV